MSHLIKATVDLEEFKRVFNDALEKKALEVVFQGKVIDISDSALVKTTLDTIEKKLEEKSNLPDLDDKEEKNEENDSSPIILDIALNDERIEIASEAIKQSIQKVSYQGLLDWGDYKRKPYPHQEEGVRWLLGLALQREKETKIMGGLLADDMGLGKTYVSLSGIDHFQKLCNFDTHTGEKHIFKPILVIAPLSLLETWKQEVQLTFSKSPFDDLVVLQSSADLNRFKIKGVGPEIRNKDKGIKYALKVGSRYGIDRLDLPKRLVLTTYQVLRDYQFSLCQVDWSFAILDEAQNIKNPNALQTRAAKAIKADFILLATGTPVENSLVDFWCLFDTACPGLLGSYQEFRKKFILPINKAPEDEVERVKILIGRKLREEVGQYMLRRVKEDHLEGLPTKTFFVGIKDENAGWQYHQNLDCLMTGKQLELYDEIVHSVKKGDMNEVLPALHRLRDVSLHPALVEGGIPEISANKKQLTEILRESSKLLGILKILDEIRRRQEKVIIFLINKRLQRFLSISLSALYNLGSIHIINGDIKAVSRKAGAQTRTSMIRAFENVNGFNIIIMSPIAAGVGLTVTGANNVIHLERHWNPAKESQATDRVYRIGQKLDVNIFIPISKHPEMESFDVNLHHLLWQKSSLKDAVVTTEQVVPSPPFPHGVDQYSVIKLEDLKSISWKEFEALSAEIYSREYKADSTWLTPDTNDYGADIVILGPKNKVLIQCKYTRSSVLTGHTAVTSLKIAQKIYERRLNKKFPQLLLVTNAPRISKEIRLLAKEDNVEIHNLGNLQKFLKKYSLSRADIFKRLEKGRLRI